jgi:hypothetical protein
MLRDKILRQVYCKLIKTIKNVNDKLFISHTEIVKWPTNTAQGAHFDFSFAPCTTILYLNDNYEGGETFLEKKIITPKKGNLIFFKGKTIEHGVKKITKGTRYTIPCWWDSI